MIRIENITVEKGGKAIFSGLNFHIHSGDHILISGRSGAGKSTLLKTILLFEVLQSGSIILKDEVVDGVNVEQFRRQIGYIGQKAPHYDGTVREFLELPFSFKANADLIKPTSDDIDRLCQQFSFEQSPFDQPYSSLSGGEQQRISIVQALLIDRPIYLLDEVTASLDPTNTRKVVDYICGMKDKTVLVVSHDPEWRGAVSKVVHVDKGILKEASQ